MSKLPDLLLFDQQLTEEELAIQKTVRDYCDKSLMPRIQKANREELFDKEIYKELADLGLLGPHIKGYGCSGVSNVAYGLILHELERGDSGLRSFASVQGSLVMYPIHKFGSENQKEKWLKDLGTGKKIGCFGLTEPDHGSNPGGMITNFKDDGDHVILNGAKMWISNSPFADIAVVWAKNEENRIKGVIVESNSAVSSSTSICSKPHTQSKSE